MAKPSKGSSRCTAALNAANVTPKSSNNKHNVDSIILFSSRKTSNIFRIDSNQNARQERNTGSLQKNKPFKTAPKTSPGSAPRRHDSRLRMAALSKTKKQLFTEPRSSTQKACMLDAENKTMSTTAVPPLVTNFCGSTKASFRDGSVLSAPPKKLSRPSYGRSSLR